MTRSFVGSRRLGLALLLAVMVAGCQPMATSSVDVGVDALSGPYQAEPIELDAATVDLFAQACQRELPFAVAPGDSPAIVDARGLGVVTLVFITPDRTANRCLLQIAEDGELSASPLGTSNLGGALPNRDSVVSIPHTTRDTNDGTWAFAEGLVGSAVARLTLELPDGSRIAASIADGFYVAAWPNDQAWVRRRTYDADGQLLQAEPQ